MSEKNVLKISDFNLAFGDNVLFENFEIELKPGIYIFSGPSGVGKSTLMRVLAGLERRHTGKIELNGKILEGYSPDVHMMHQHYTSFPWLNIIDNALMVYKGHKVKPTNADIDEAIEVLGRLGLAEHLKKRPSQISGGQDQRLSLASAFINRWSPVILYDEPTSALDNLNDTLVVDMIREHQAKYGTIEIVITHEEHVVQGLDGTILEFTPEFRLREPKEQPISEDVTELPTNVATVEVTASNLVDDLKKSRGTDAVQTVEVSATELIKDLAEPIVESTEESLKDAEVTETTTTTQNKQSKFKLLVSRIFKKDTDGA